jgi:hypothetical protein
MAAVPGDVDVDDEGALDVLAPLRVVEPTVAEAAVAIKTAVLQ